MAGVQYKLHQGMTGGTKKNDIKAQTEALRSAIRSQNFELWLDEFRRDGAAELVVAQRAVSASHNATAGCRSYIYRRLQLSVPQLCSSGQRILENIGQGQMFDRNTVPAV
eukprot:4976536-Pleurochrysis_carterae.AAC.1